MENQELASYNLVLDQEYEKGKLFISNLDFVYSPKHLQLQNIKAVVTACPVTIDGLSQDIQILKFPLLDSQYQLEHIKLIKIFEECFYFIQDQRQKSNNVVVHCVVGISRSATIVIAYLMRSNNWTFTKSYNFLKEKRPEIKPNKSFVKALKEYETFIGVESPSKL